MGKIVSIHSFRGGTGKSNTTANLAAQTAMAGYRVGVVDTDIQSPGIHVLFGLDESSIAHTLNEYLHGQCKMEDVVHLVGNDPLCGSGCKQLAGKSLWLIPSSIKITEISRIVKEGYDVNLLNKGLNSLLKEFKLDYLFIDTHPGLNEETLLSVAISDILIIILRPDQQDFQGTAVTVDIARSLDVPNLFLMVNKALTKYDFEQMRETIQKTYNASIAGILPLNEEMVELGSSDIFSLRFPDHPWSQTLRKVAAVITSV
jgi:septum site-determining protein MinD